jgi:hypothetical protein
MKVEIVLSDEDVKKLIFSHLKPDFPLVDNKMGGMWRLKIQRLNQKGEWVEVTVRAVYEDSISIRLEE